MPTRSISDPVRRLRWSLPILAVFFIPLSAHAESERLSGWTGVYTSEDGAEARVYHTEDSSEAVMHLRSPAQRPLTLFLKRSDAATFRPQGLNVTVDFDRREMSIIGYGNALYGVGTTDEREVEFYASSKDAAVEVAVDRRFSSGGAEAVEARLMGRDFAQTWSKIRSARIVIQDEGLQIAPEGQPTVARQIGNHVIEETVLPTPFRRIADLNDQELADFEARRKERSNQVARLESFLSKKLRQEGGK